ncbi:hypothetical protein BGZ54_008749 [Gamsiella multidivaricata]|nr:hypothetical protein BGZ54_008749 [Gamsiella multidivaricata]
MTPVTDILPFVSPLADPSLTETDFSVAVDDWNETLSKILKLNNKAFWAELLRNPSLAGFLNAFLGEYASFRGNKGDLWIMELEEVVRRVFMIYRRISETMSGLDAMAVSGETFADQSLNDPGSALLDCGLVSTSVLMDLAGIYGRSDPEGVSKMVGSILEHTPSLINDFRTSTNTVVQIIHRVQKRFEKGVNGGAGKGKGKGKGVSPAISPEPHAPVLDLERMTETMQYTSALSDIAFALDAVSAAHPLLAMELNQHPTFLECLMGCYNYTLPILSKVLIENQSIGDINVRPALTFLRLRILSIVNNILEGIHKQLLAVTANGHLDGNAAAALTDNLCEVIVNLYEQSPLQDHMVPMFDATMILDLEIQFSISEKLSTINKETFQGENDRLNHWVVVLSDLREFNDATRTYIYEHNMRKSENLAREMSHLYINQDHDRSNSTITSNNNQPRVPLPSMFVDQEKAYIRRTMLISQLQDLFPDLGDGFLEACLITFKDDPEVVTMRLLEEDLPSDLAMMDRSTARSMFQRPQSDPTSMELVRVSPSVEQEEQDLLSSRRNIFDGDEFDVFSGKVVDKSKVSRGKKGPADVEVVLDDKTFVTQHKSSILQAVESMYDDEYDDTYDSMGVNTVGADFRSVEEIESFTDTSAKNTGTPAQTIDPSIEHEEVLINMYTSNKDVFNRSREARRSKQRQDLRNLTKMSDEQLEGWAVMFGRNPRKAEIAQKYEFSGRQTMIAQAEPIDKRRGGRMPFVDKNTGQGKPQQQQQQHGPKSPQQQKKTQPPKPRAQPQSRESAPSPQPSKLSQTPSQDHSSSQQGPRTPSGNNNDAPSMRDRAKNERQKSSKANHNRRNQHAKKMASMNP